jgi:hypothetical protein
MIQRLQEFTGIPADDRFNTDQKPLRAEDFAWSGKVFAPPPQPEQLLIEF